MTNRTSSLITWGLLLSALLLQPLQAKERVLTACGHHDYPPFNWRDGDRTVGVGADVVTQIFAKFGIEVKAIYAGPWKRCLEAVRHGKVDVVVAAYATDERKQYAEFTATPLSEDHKSAFVWKGREFPFADWKDLKGKRAGIQRGVSYGQKFDDFLAQNVHVIQVSKRQQYFKMLELGRIDFIPTGAHIGLIHARRAGFDQQIVALDHPISVGYLHIGISKRSPFRKYLPQVDEQLTQLRNSGVIDAMVKRYLTQYLENMPKGE